MQWNLFIWVSQLCRGLTVSHVLLVISCLSFNLQVQGVFIVRLVCLVLVAVLPFVPPRQSRAPSVPRLVLNLWQCFHVSPSVFSLLPPHSVLHLVLDLFCPCHFHWNIQEEAWQIHFLFSSSTSCLLFPSFIASYCLPMNCPLMWLWTSRIYLLITLLSCFAHSELVMPVSASSYLHFLGHEYFSSLRCHETLQLPDGT